VDSLTVKILTKFITKTLHNLSINIRSCIKIIINGMIKNIWVPVIIICKDDMCKFVPFGICVWADRRYSKQSTTESGIMYLPMELMRWSLSILMYLSSTFLSLNHSICPDRWIGFPFPLCMMDENTMHLATLCKTDTYYT